MAFLNGTHLKRRDFLQGTAGASIAGMFASGFSLQSQGSQGTSPKPVAAVITHYRKGSHADVILGKILEGWQHDGGPGPALELAAVYVDQFPDDEVGRQICAKYSVPIVDSIDQALTLGTNKIVVDGVISIGEHGDYPINAIGQQLYPRRRFFDEISSSMAKHSRIVPVFNDKHLGPMWADAKWMYDRAKDLEIPFMAGSSMPVGFRIGQIRLPMGCEIESAVGIGYSGLDIYGSHALELYQYYIERRVGAERGVRSVQCLSGPEAWKTIDSGRVSQAAFDAAFAITPKTGDPDPRLEENVKLFLFQYNDGLTGAIFMMDCVHGTSVGLKLKNSQTALATAFDERTEPRYPHFAYLLKAIERMVHSGRPTYPVERTLLTSGILDAALHSLAQDGKEIRTPHLEIHYRPVDYPHAEDVQLN